MVRNNIRFLASTARVQKEISYSNTLHLPKTSFGPKIPIKEERLKLIKETSQDLYKWQIKRRDYSKIFTLHDGPPYANGDLHLGHALNKISKDIINRFELIYNNSKVNYRPGWDCHGLPIEMKAISYSKNFSKLSAVEIRSLCGSLALSMIEKQREQFLDFGIMADFNDPYITMSHEYEINQLKVFQKLIENGLLSRQLKPVWWGCETQTALAEAELEYNNNHNSTAIYVKFPVISKELYDIIQSKFSFVKLSDNSLKLLIWTSTVWTIPANKAICVNKHMDYTLIKNKSTNENLIVEESLANDLTCLNESFEKYESPISIKGEELIGFKYINPASQTSERFPILHGDHVTATAGSGLVHTAPAHGSEDYLIGKQHNLAIISSVNFKGEFIEDVLPNGFKSLKGERATDKEGIWKCINILQENDMVFYINQKFKHSYPYDWRSNTPVIQRATPQWFVNVEKTKYAAIKALENVKFVPESGRNRLSSFIGNRNEWCISRQRTWGVPLPIVYNKETGEPIEDIKVIEHIIDRIDEFGTNEWFVLEDDISRWLPEYMKDKGTLYTKGKDTMDVWFDSGTSWTTLGSDINETFSSNEPLADVYIEGSDQHRGWFQSSLLNKIIASGTIDDGFKPIAPFKEIITHGFTLDNKNDKMSKSKGNVISPKDVIAGRSKPFLPSLGTDGLRLWVASSNYTTDVTVSSEILSRVFENMKKLRITLKYMLGNLNDFKTPVEYKNLNAVDKLVLSRLYKLQNNCIEFYKDHNFSRVIKEINTHVSSDLSASYFDISKDCLYTDFKDSNRRRSIQTVLQILLKTYIGLLAPIQPILAQEAWNAYALLFNREETSPFMLGKWDEFYKLPTTYINESVEKEFDQIWDIKDHIYKNLESLRIDGSFKNKLETQVNIIVDETSSIGKLLQNHSRFLDDYFLVSKVSINQSLPLHVAYNKVFAVISDGKELTIELAPSLDAKCPRCWKFVSESEDQLCKKCNSVVHNH